MMKTMASHVLFGLLFVFCFGSVASAKADASKEVCIDAHGRGQDARESGKITLARKLFMTCAQSSCPALIKDDCARYSDELERLQPSLTFAARDANGTDMPDTSVYVDEQLVLTRVDDGRPHEVDPGKHTVRFSNSGHDESVTLVVGAGEKGRAVVGTFPAPEGSAPVATQTAVETPKEPEVHHALGSRVMLSGGAAVLAVGTAMGVVGLIRVPSQCSVSTHECAAPPGHKSFDKASSAIRLSNVGWSVAGAGGAALIGGLIWYFKSAKTDDETQTVEVTPFATPESAGLTLGGRL